jgi:putative flippase GtrA
MSTNPKSVAAAHAPLGTVARKFSRFLLVGGLCTGLQYVLLIALVEGAALSPTLASTVGYLASSAVNYLLNYSFTFRSAAQHRHALPKFVLISSVGLILNAAITFAGTALLGVQHYLLAQVAATCITLLWNFFANHRWTF